MGEPLDNTDEVLRVLEIITAEWGFGWSPTRITLSTAGVVPELRRFLDATKVHLAVSLHNPFHEERMEIMPVERAWPIAEVAAILREYDFTHQRRVSFEYIVMSGLNDFGFDCKAFAAGLQYEHPTVQQRFFALLRTCILFMAEEGNVHIDDRNRASYRMCREIAEQLKDHHLPCR